MVDAVSEDPPCRLRTVLNDSLSDNVGALTSISSLLSRRRNSSVLSSCDLSSSIMLSRSQSSASSNKNDVHPALRAVGNASQIGAIMPKWASRSKRNE